MKPYVLDACALIAYFNDEEGAGVVEALFTEEKELVISMLTVYEVYYYTVRTSGEENAISLLNDIDALPIRIIKDINRDIIIEAAKFKIKFYVVPGGLDRFGIRKAHRRIYCYSRSS